MAEILATKTSLAGNEMPDTFEAVRAEALFASTVQPSGSPSPDQIRRAVATTLQRLGVRGCAARVAGEFGDHPDAAVARMGWALATISTVYPARSTGSTGKLAARLLHEAGVARLSVASRNARRSRHAP